MMRALFTFCFVLIVALTFAKPMKVTTLKEIAHLWEDIDSETLIIFDIDDVIISTIDHFAHPYGYKTFVELTNKALEKALTVEEKEEIMRKVSLSQLLAKRVLVEEDIPSLIKDLQNSGAKVIALTSFPRGQYGAIQRVETWRLEHLQGLDISFKNAFPNVQSAEFVSDAFTHGVPSFEEGILFADECPKGDVLKAFFAYINYHPSKIIFIDDSLHQHESVERAVEELGIPYQGVHYLGATKYFKSLDEVVMSYQFNYLIEREVWLSDEEVLDHLKRQENE